MAEHADKTPDRKSPAAEHKIAQPQGSLLGFVDNRMEGVMQRKFQEVAAHDPYHYPRVYRYTSMHNSKEKAALYVG